MNLTVFLAQLWGPAILAVGLGILLNRGYYVQLYRDLNKNSLAGLTFGMFAIAAGIAQVLVHNAWTSFPVGLISFLGWGLLVKGFVFTIFPKFVDKMGDWEADSKLVPSAGVLVLIIGFYVTVIGYFM